MRLCLTPLFKQFKHIQTSLGMSERMWLTTIVILYTWLRHIDVFQRTPQPKPRA